ncbi:hypothetical protein CLV24_10174 [Pontibacter ummariensis]|uniref:Tetratricopeptide repeat-containing protein n=1 Tax=Pontibacter ummariensis TaxID=1610492 RepID=A0A239B2K7_9BACT|nr:hypothetical protein [Pontibacter ummariensis]PRY16230.1 hypothetical protein CLV24_10174 [Pontibacter ummariensis]SNS01478.1 hypothetical protein SAMN06296052_10174 [Pontibacter ummariensis]
MRQAVLLFLFLWAACSVQAQTKLVFEETRPEAYLMRQVPNSGSQANLNNIINLLDQANVRAKGGGRPSRKPEFTLKFEQQARIADAGEQLQLKVQLAKLTVGGDVLYKGFDLSEVLLPEKMSYKVNLLQGQNKVVKVYDRTATFRPGGMVLLEETIPDTAANQNYQLKIEEKQLVYTPEDVHRVQERLRLVEDYFAANAAIAGALQEAGRLMPDDIDRITLHDRKLYELEELYTHLKGNKFNEKLKLQQHDPQRLNDKLSQLQQVLQERRRAINFVLATLDQQFYNRGVSLLRNGNRSAAQAYFQKSVEVNPKFAPSHVQLAHVDFLSGYLQEAAGRLRDVLTRMRIDPETEEMAMGLAHDIYSSYISQGSSLTSRGDFHQALDAYADARELCSAIGGLRCSLPALNDGEGRAATGAFRAMVDRGSGLLSRNELREAERVAQDALRFQQEYDYVLHGAREASELLGQVKFQYYLQYIDQGQQALSQKNYAEALHQFEAALELEQQYTFKPVQELPGLAKKAAKPVLLSKLSQGYEQAMQNQLTAARDIAAEATAMQEQYALLSDTEVLAKAKLLRDRIFTQECINAQASYDKHFQNAKNLVREKKYIAADQAYQAAISGAEALPSCNIATFTARDGRAAIAVAVNYQRKLKDVNRLVSSNRYTEAIQLYEEAEGHYLANGISKFGLDHIVLFNYAKDNRKQAFTAAVVHYFAGKREEEAAVQLLSSLLERGYAKGKTKKVQEQLGRQLATKDAALALEEDAKVLAAQHTANKKGLKKLRKAYEKESRRLARM